MQSHSMIKQLSRLVLFSAAALLIAGCASKPTIQTDYDHSVDFSQFRTYGFL